MTNSERQSHIIDDLATDLAKCRRKMTNAVTLLTNAQHALENGRLVVVDEFLDRAIEHLS